MKYEYLEHTADVKFKAYGKTLEEAFKNAAYATTDIITDHTKVNKNITKKISIESEDKKALLYDFIEQLIILLDSESFLLSEVRNITIKDNKLSAEIIGDDKPENYDINMHIKAVTYQEMEIKEEKDKVMLQVIIDI